MEIIGLAFFLFVCLFSFLSFCTNLPHSTNTFHDVFSSRKKNESIYNLLVIINKLSHALSLLIDSGEPEDIVDEGNILNIYHSTVIIQRANYVQMICFLNYLHLLLLLL